MDYQPYDSSGTDDDLPPSHQSRMPRGNGRPIVSSMPYPTMYGETDMETQIHQLEHEAYSSVLRAFQAQADAITWKESLITELRNELRLSNEEHRELLNRVNADDDIRRIREWRETSVLPSVSASHQHSLSAKIGSLSGSKSKKQKLGTSSVKLIPFTAAGPSRRSQVANRVSSQTIPKGATTELIGKKIRTKWPDDNNFYEAVILDYNALEGRHALVYDIGTGNETWEWVDLTEISPEDIQWVDDDLLSPHNCIGKKNPYDIQILHTDTLIKEVERVFGTNHPDPSEVEKAKKLLKDHEQALVDAISRLADFPDGESEEGGGHYRQALERL